jgi:16S rRNA processing protein RimM
VKPFAELVSIGRLVRPQGRKGELLAEPHSDRPDRFPTLRRAFVPGASGSAREVEVTSCWPHKGRFVLKLEGVDSIDQAEGYRGLELGIGEEELEALPAGSYYHHQLLGLAVQDESGEMLGTVQGVLETGAEARVLEVRGPRGELLVPMAETFIRTVDLANRRVTVTLRELVEC